MKTFNELKEIGVRGLKKQKKVKKSCNCKNSRCLKLYCDCFASGEYCGEHCKCINCFNQPSKETIKARAIQAILDRNPSAFNPKVISGKVLIQS